jgi:hypothetical protein
MKGSLSACFVRTDASTIDGLANIAVSRTAPSAICIGAALVPRPLERISFASRNAFAYALTVASGTPSACARSETNIPKLANVRPRKRDS